MVYDGMPVPTSDAMLDELFSAGYSVSLFTDWGGRSPNQLWLKQVGRPGRRRQPGGSAPIAADGPRHPVAGMPAGHCTQQLGVPGPWYERLPHFRLEFTPSAGDELQSEFLVARGDAVAALAAVAEIRDRIAPVLHISELRTVAADDLWLSPSYRRDSLAIHFTWIKDPAAVAPVIAAVEERLAPFAPGRTGASSSRPTRPPLRGRYERFDDFAALARRYDPAGKFRNRWLDALLRTLILRNRPTSPLILTRVMRALVDHPRSMITGSWWVEAVGQRPGRPRPPGGRGPAPGRCGRHRPL